MKRTPTNEEIEAFKYCKGGIPAMQAFLDKHPDAVDARFGTGTTALAHAAKEQQSSIVEFLLQYGADPNIECVERHTALIYASASVWVINKDSIRALLRYGARPNAVTIGGKSALHFVADKGDVEAAKLLVAAGADVNLADKCGLTPLMNAAQAGHVEMVKFLLERGANEKAVSDAGETAETYAVLSRQAIIAAIIIRNWATSKEKERQDREFTEALKNIHMVLPRNIPVLRPMLRRKSSPPQP